MEDIVIKLIMLAHVIIFIVLLDRHITIDNIKRILFSNITLLFFIISILSTSILLSIISLLVLVVNSYFIDRDFMFFNLLTGSIIIMYSRSMLC